jgi:hypothetical protein
MSGLRILVLLLVSLVSSKSLDEINEEVWLASKKYWTEQFSVFEENGFTEEMIEGGRKIYFRDDYSKKMNGTTMFLWTIHRGDIYLEENPSLEHTELTVNWVNWMAWTIQKAMVSKNFPRDVTFSFWSQVNKDQEVWEGWDNTRLDLLHPSIFYDNRAAEYNVITVPDPYTLARYDERQIYARICMDKNRVDWDKKQSQAYFRGALSSQLRLEMFWLAEQKPEMFDLYVTFLDYFRIEQLPEKYRIHNHGKVAKFYALCDQQQYKYMLSLDGLVSGWERFYQILYSESVPVLVESKYSPIYQKYWVPYVHYVPVKADLSDLLERLEWLRTNDEKAKEIGLNGKSLYLKLYNIQNLMDDAATVFQKYASLLRYEVAVPNPNLKFKHKYWDKKKKIVFYATEVDDDDMDFDDGEEEDEEKEEL